MALLSVELKCTYTILPRKRGEVDVSLASIRLELTGYNCVNNQCYTKTYIFSTALVQDILITKYQDLHLD